MSEPEPTSVRRIYLAMDLSSHGPAALEAAVKLATEMRAELHGLFIEDDDLLRVASLPFTCEIDYASGSSRPLNAGAVEQSLRKRAEELRQVISETARRTSLHWSFRITRGRFVQTMLTESLQADLLLIAREKSSSARSSATSRRGPVLVIDDDDHPNEPLLAAAQCLARASREPIVILLAGPESVQAEKYAALGSSCYLQRCSKEMPSLMQAIRHWRPQLVLLDRAGSFAAEANVDALLEQLPCPLVLVQTARDLPTSH